MLRLFVAIHPPADARAVIGGLPRPLHPTLRWTTSDQWHITLRFLGPTGEDRVPALVDALRTLERLTPVVARLGPATGRFRRSVLHVPVDGLDDLAVAVAEAAAKVGFEAAGDVKGFLGHLTLARSRGRHGSTAVTQLAGQTVEPRAWTVTSVALVESVLGGSGASYTDLAVIPLLGGR